MEGEIGNGASPWHFLFIYNNLYWSAVGQHAGSNMPLSNEDINVSHVSLLFLCPESALTMEHLTQFRTVLRHYVNFLQKQKVSFANKIPSLIPRFPFRSCLWSDYSCLGKGEGSKGEGSYPRPLVSVRFRESIDELAILYPPFSSV